MRQIHYENHEELLWLIDLYKAVGWINQADSSYSKYKAFYNNKVRGFAEIRQTAFYIITVSRIGPLVPTITVKEVKAKLDQLKISV